MPAGNGVVTPPASATRRDLAVTIGGVAAIVAWELLGWDLPLSRLFGGVSGFALRDAWFTDTVLHSGGRALAALALVVLAADLLRSSAGGPARAQRAYWFAVIVIALTLVPALKRLSLTSCPWDLAEFGGTAAYVPHWLPGAGDGGPGRCFPSGHAVSAFAFFGLYFLWRPLWPGRARLALAAVAALGALYGFGQLARGAHFASHTMWSAWLAWAICAVAQAVSGNLGAGVARAGAAAHTDAAAHTSG